MQAKLALQALAGSVAVYVALAINAGDTPSSFVGAALDPVSPAHAEVSGTRLKAKYISGADGSKLFDAENLYDTQLGVDCKFTSTGFIPDTDPNQVTASDDKIRCLPSPGPYSDSITGGPKYSDTSCTQPVVELAELPGTPSGCTAVYPKWVWYLEFVGYCSIHYRVHMFEVEPGTLSSANVYRKNGSNCELVGGVPSLKLKPEAPATTFAEGTLGTDP